MIQYSGSEVRQLAAESQVDPVFQWPDLLLQIECNSRPEGRVSLRFRGVWKGEEHREFGHVDIYNPFLRANQLGRVLDEWADASKSSDIEALSSHLNGIGIQFFRELIPPELQEHYWTHLHPVPGSTVLVLADAGAVPLPWEIIKPARDAEEAPFWCEHLSLSRWMSASPITQSLPGQPVACVHADPELDDVAEVAQMQLHPQNVITTWPELKNLLKCEGIGVFHWTGHGEPCPENPSLSALPISGETFRPVDLLSLDHHRFLSTHPWVFLHACSTSRTAGALMGLGGWPSDLIGAGAGAVLGTAWDVRTSTAIPFVEHLYRLLLNDTTVGDAVRLARGNARREGDPSWLSYQLYAHPAARLIKESRIGVRTDSSVQLIIQQTFPGPDDDELGWRRDYLRRIMDHECDASGAIVTLAGTAEIDEGLDYSTIYVEPAMPGEGVISQSFTNIVDAVQQYKAVVLLGRSGSGKTATLRKIMYQLASSTLNGQSGIPTPIYLSLADYGSDDEPLAYVKGCCDKTVRPRLEEELEKKRVCLLCDGLNELSRTNYLKQVRAWRNLMNQYPDNWFVFACRTSQYQDELHLQKVEISPLDDERVIRSLFASVGEDADALWEAIQDGGLLDLARMPLFLHWILQSYRRSGGRLPGNRSLLLKGLLESLVRREKESGAYESLPLDIFTESLAEIAFELQSETFDGAIPRKRAVAIIKDRIEERDAVATVITDALNFALTVGVLKQTGGKLLFSDRQFRDYYAVRGPLQPF